VYAVGHPRHRPVSGRRGGRRAVRAVGVHRGRSGRTRVAHRRAGGQYDGRGHAGKVGEQQSRVRAARQEAVPRAGVRLARRRSSVMR